MTVVRDHHDRHGATYRDAGDRRTVDHYGRPARAHRAVRNGAGVIEADHGVLAVTGEDRVAFVDNAVSNRVPGTDGRGCYALLLDPQGAIQTDLHVYVAGDRLLVFTPPGRARPLADDWRDKTFIQDVDVRVATDEFGVFGVHGPSATEKVASVLTGAAPPDERLSFVRGRMDDVGVTVIRGDGLAGEEGYAVVCAAAGAADVFDTLLTRGMNAPPFGVRTWESLTLEAGTPLFEPELEGEIPNVLGLRNALDFEKGCYVGQEVVSRVENQGRPSRRLVGLTVETDAVPDPDAAVFEGDAAVGEVTRAVESPSLDRVLALALVASDLTADRLAARVAGEEVPAAVTPLPFVEGSERSARIPAYPGLDVDAP